MFVCCECCVLSGRGLCDELITRPEQSYRLWCVVVCDLETSRMRRAWPTGGCCAKYIYIYIYIRLYFIYIYIYIYKVQSCNTNIKCASPPCFRTTVPFSRRTKCRFLKNHCHCEAVIYTIMVCSSFVVEGLLGIKVQLYKIF